MKSASIFAQTALALCSVAGSYASTGRSQQHVLMPPPPFPGSNPPQSSAKGSKQFSLRSIYHVGSHQFPGLMRKIEVDDDVALVQAESSLDGISADTVFDVAIKSATVERMVDRSRRTVDSILDAGRTMRDAPYLPPEAWTTEEIDGPNVTDKKSVLSLAYMAANAYILTPGTGDWKDIKGAFNYTEDFGWEKDGLRGHIFADTTNSTVVISVKGTSMAIFDGADTTGHDKDNDNLFGSCCCAQYGQVMWKKVCDCKTTAYTCNNTCLTTTLREKSNYYHAGQDLYHNVAERYPNANIWMTGHSLGGVVSALLGLTYGLPVVTFETYPDALAAGRLGLPTPPGFRIGRHQDRNNTQITHFGHTADPIFMGTCNAATSGCTLAGYAFESQCHTGSVATYNTVEDLGWRSGVNSHRISIVINDVLKAYDDVPPTEVDSDCTDCSLWKFFESNSTETTTTAQSSTTKTKSSTRTATCQTPGWFGCLDETTSTEVTTTETLTTTSCLTPGWFGCKDLVTATLTTTITTSTAVQAVPTVTTTTVRATTTTRVVTTTATSKTTTKPSTKTSTTCTSPGWFGCLDPSPTTASSASLTTGPSYTRPTGSTSTGSTCTSRGWFGCKDPKSQTAKMTDL